MEMQLADIRACWSEETKWPSNPESTANNAALVSSVRKHQAWIKGLVDGMKLMQEENKKLRKELEELKKSKKEATALAPLDWSKIMAGDVHKDENAVAMMATMANEMKKKAERANNVIASIPAELCTEGGDDSLVKGLISEIGVA